MENLDETEKFDDDLISTETLHDIRDGNQTHPKIDKREARMAMRDRIKQNKSQCIGAFRATQKMGKGLHRVFRNIVSEILQELTNLGETGSEVSHLRVLFCPCVVRKARAHVETKTLNMRHQAQKGFASSSWEYHSIKKDNWCTYPVLER